MKPVDRLRQMNTNDPKRAYQFAFLCPVEDMKEAEGFMHRVLKGYREGVGEWFKISPEDAQEMFLMLSEGDQRKENI